MMKEIKCCICYKDKTLRYVADMGYLYCAECYAEYIEQDLKMPVNNYNIEEVIELLKHDRFSEK